MDWSDWIKWPFQAMSDAQGDLAYIRKAVRGIPARFTELERLIMATKQELLTRLDSASNEIASDLSSLRDRLQQAVADKDQAVQDAVGAVLGEFDAPIARLESLGQDPANPIPDPEPTPDPAPVDPGATPVDPAPAVDADGNPIDSDGNPV